MGFFNRLLGTVPYMLCFCCAAIILGFYSYFLAVLSDRDRPIPNWEKAVEGIAGVSVVYTITAIVLTPFLGGIRFLAFLGMFLDVVFAGAFIALAVLTRDGVKACTGNIDTPLGSGNAETGNGFGADGFGTNDGEQVTYQASFGTACRFNKACFAVSIIGAFLFLFAALCQFWFARRVQKEKRFGPSPANNYTSGSGSKRGPFWKRNRNAAPADSQLGTFGAGAPAAAAVGGANVDTRPSGDTAYTGSTVGPNSANRYDPYKAEPAYGGNAAAAPTSNPYGYEKPHAGNY